MLSPKVKLPVANSQVIKQNNEDSKCNTIRIVLLVWAFLRLLVSMLWAGILILVTVSTYYTQNPGIPQSRYYFGPFVILIQLIEFGMLVTFIVAGFKKSASLYLVYYWYCIVTLVIFVVAVPLSLSLGYDNGHYFGDLYMFYTIFAAFFINNELLSLIYSIFDFGLEILLIHLIKMLINNYGRYGNEHVAGEAV